MFRKLKDKWGVSWGRFVLIFITFALGGSLCGYLGEIVLEWMSIESKALRIPAYIILVTLLWPLCVLAISIFTGQFVFFRGYIAKLLARIAGKKRQS